ncbi:MAG TPA: STAS/SEC14 domain-containing protein [Bacteroidia bacterium]|jgi:hypothetical protein|nr:STAS/SEC14 domain-containing protein [Bacteroidia bacterium]
MSLMQAGKNNPVKTTAYTTWMGEDGIARTVVKKNAEVKLKEAVENTEAVFSLFKDKKFPLLIDSRYIKYITKEARDHFSINNRETVIICFGILIDSPLSRVIGNFFMGLNKPSVPAKLFTNEEEALKWLKKFL